MSSTLNLYASKIFEEHPTSLWTLDEPIGYLNLGGPSLNDISNWSVTGANKINSSQLASELPGIPDYNLNTVAQSYAGTGGLITLSSPATIQQSEVSQDLASVAFGMYVYVPDRSIEIRVGVSYLNEQGQNEIIRATRVDPVIDVPARSRKMWAFVSFTFELPDAFTDLEPFVEISYEESVVPLELSVFGLTFGQWAEEFQSTSAGVFAQTIPSEIPIDNSAGLSAVEAKPYGLQGLSGYYLVSSNRLLARNTGIPLVFGTDNSSVLYPGNGIPSIVIPGNGFLNQEGKYREQTFEFWASIHSNATTAKKIFGPLTSADGLYVDKHLLKLKVGQQEASYSVGEWGRPMLVDIRTGKTNVSVLINGVQVMLVPLDQSNYPDSSEDWLGFFAYDEVPTVQIECVAVYPYEVSAIVQKRRFVYGQGVEFPTSNLSHSSIISFDHSVSGTAKNVRYPQTTPWSSGVYSNMEPKDTSLSLPEYKLPELISSAANSWEAAMTSIFDSSNPTFSLKPNSSFSDADTYLYFENMAFLKNSPAAIFGVFEVGSLPVAGTEQVVFEISRKSDLVSMAKVTVNSDGELEYRGEILPEFTSNKLSPGDIFVAGFKISDTNISSYNVYVGGTPAKNNTFDGKVYRVSMASQEDLGNFGNLFDSNSIAVIDADSIATQSYAMYTLVPTMPIDSFKLDIAVRSVWQDYIPISYFAKLVLDANNEYYKAVDFLQFNVDYVKLENYIDDKYDTSELPVKTYIAFEYLNSGVSPSRPNIQKLDRSGIVQPADEWVSTKYEVLNDTIIKFPRGVDRFSLGMIVYIEVNSDGIVSDNISIKNLDISSRSFSNQPNRVPTQFGPPVIPYKRSGNYFEYKIVSPFSIGKESSPYLHLTKYSGIKSRIPYNYNSNEGISIPINPKPDTSNDFFKVDLLQFSMKYSEKEFPTTPVKLFEIENIDSYIKFYLVADSANRERGQVYAIDSFTGALRSDIVTFVNGRPSKRAIINKNIWSMISLSFLNGLDFSNKSGAFRITSPISLDNLCFYQQSQVDDVRRFSFRKWSAIRSGIDITFDWEYWKDSTWQEVLYLAESNAELSDPELTYKTFTGTNSFIFDSSSTLVFNNYRSSAYKDLVWTTSTITPV